LGPAQRDGHHVGLLTSDQHGLGAASHVDPAAARRSDTFPVTVSLAPTSAAIVLPPGVAYVPVTAIQQGPACLLRDGASVSASLSRLE
jgi:hypothetical protein